MTRREREMVPLVGRGFTNQELAGSMRISVKTVEHYVHELKVHYGARNRFQLISMIAMRMG